MRSPYCCFQAQIRSTSPSRPTSWRVLLSFSFSCFSTTACVTMPAWSMPGIQTVLNPRMRWTRTRMSCRVVLIAWPRCSAPVTFGGGMTMLYGSPDLAGSAAKHFSSSQTRVASASTAAGS